MPVYGPNLVGARHDLAEGGWSARRRLVALLACIAAPWVLVAAALVLS
jgi:hypothetical protein